MDLHRPWVGVAAALLFTGCPGKLENPERFTATSTSADASTSGDGDACGVEALIEDTCAGSGCHDDSSAPQGELDLISPGVGERLIGVPSATCDERTRVDPADVEGSFFMEKLEEAPECGSRMPLVGMGLSADEKECLQGWLEELAGGGGSEDPVDGGDGTMDDTPDGGNAGDGGAL